MNLLVWIIFGALAGWIASIVMRTDGEQGGFMNVVIGIAGAVVGGFVMNLLGNSGVSGFNLYSLLVAIMGSIVLIALVRAIRSHS